ncbi:MAG: sigma 54-interacting transcriptional regulator [Myxococcales bacterium]|jgi:two-component system nitrogen regulation response regulator GlnG
MTEAQASPRVLLVDDGTTYAEVIRTQLPEVQLLSPRGARDGRFEDGPAALSYLKKHAGDVDLVLLDMSFDLPAERLLPLTGASGAPVSEKRRKRFQGIAILRALRERHPALPVVLLTSHQDLSLSDVGEELASESMTYVLDGDDLDTLRIRIHGALAEAALGLSGEDTEAGVLWGGDREVSALRRRLAVVARGSMPVILEGETGTGKSYLAERFVHRLSGRGGPFVAVDLSTMPDSLVPAQLFGAVRGAYTGAVRDQKGVFEMADGGTLFLDEVQNLPLDVQRQLLSVLQERRVRPLGSARQVPVDVKVVAASNARLSEAVAAGRFRADLYMRLSPATQIEIPPLRTRLGDLEFFARRFVERALSDPDLAGLRARVARAAGLPGDAPLSLVVGRRRKGEALTGLSLELPAPAWQRLKEHRWPGNLRELSMVMHNLVAFTLVHAVDALSSGVALSQPRLQVDPGLLGELLAGSAGLAAPAADDDDGSGAEGGDGIGVRLSPQSTLNQVAQDVERQYLVALFRRTRGDFAQMAKLLLGDESRTRAVRLRFNQLGLKVRELREG